MISERKYKKALQTIRDYEQQLSLSVVSSRYFDVEYSTLQEAASSFLPLSSDDKEKYYIYQNKNHKFMVFKNELAGAIPIAVYYNGY